MNSCFKIFFIKIFRIFYKINYGNYPSLFSDGKRRFVVIVAVLQALTERLIRLNKTYINLTQLSFRNRVKCETAVVVNANCEIANSDLSEWTME